ncbi:MAG: PQQ-binding-like beta-propeller repeat protein [Deltaproteobacteria bacterium]|nr:PQQ-binding-like beta-propeller repeat protein [Deltaproteobacteria bacterium]
MSQLFTALTFAAALLRPPIAVNDAQLTEQLDGSAIKIRPSKKAIFSLQWRVPVVRTGFARKSIVSFGRPAVSHRYGLVILGTGDGNIEARNLDTGEISWVYKYGIPFESTVTLVDVPLVSLRSSAVATIQIKNPSDSTINLASFTDRQLAVLGSRDGNVLAVNAANGTLIWKTDVGGDVRASGVVAGTKLILATATNRIVALDIFKGDILWATGRPPQNTISIVGHACPLVVDDTIYAGFSDGYVASYALKDGNQHWMRSLSLRGEGFLDADADPIIADGKLFVASYEDGLFALNPSDGQTIWQRDIPAIRSIIISGKNIIAGNGNGFVWAFKLKDGELVYRTKLDSGLVTRMVTRENLLAFAGGDNGLVVLNAQTGRPLQAAAFGARMANDVIWENDTLALISENGYLYTFLRRKTKLIFK